MGGEGRAVQMGFTSGDELGLEEAVEQALIDQLEDDLELIWRAETGRKCR